MFQLSTRPKGNPAASPSSTSAELALTPKRDKIAFGAIVAGMGVSVGWMGVAVGKSEANGTAVSVAASGAGATAVFSTAATVAKPGTVAVGTRGCEVAVGVTDGVCV